ncbi:MAG: Ig-like domain-containing protein, partial [Lachnospiraceae bacterium]|nr:Ig-like domain-containing protein [Lachnospiraceae bacterium]
PLKVGQSTKKIKVTGLQSGDYVVSWKSSKPGIASVTKKGKITGKKKGTALIKVTTAAGAAYSFKIRVQPQKVATKKIVTGVPKSITLKKKHKAKIEAQLIPITTLDKLSYATSSRKIATVRKGTITAAGKGTAIITVKAGKKQIKIKLKVTD